MAIELQLEGTVTGQELNFWQGPSTSSRENSVVHLCMHLEHERSSMAESASYRDPRIHVRAESEPSRLGFCSSHRRDLLHVVLRTGCSLPNLHPGQLVLESLSELH